MYLIADAIICDRWGCRFQTWLPLGLIFFMTLTRTVITVESFLPLPIQAEEQRIQKLRGTWWGTDQILWQVLLLQDNPFQQDQHNYLLSAKRKQTAMTAGVTKNSMSLSRHCQKTALTYKVNGAIPDITASRCMSEWTVTTFLHVSLLQRLKRAASANGYTTSSNKTTTWSTSNAWTSCTHAQVSFHQGLHFAVDYFHYYTNLNFIEKILWNFYETYIPLPLKSGEK